MMILILIQTVFTLCALPEPTVSLNYFTGLREYFKTCGNLDIIPTDLRTVAPWASVIYRKAPSSNDTWKFYTSATILTPGLIFSFQTGPIGRFSSDKNPQNFFVATGINTSDFSAHDQHAQYAMVSFIQPFGGLSVDGNFLHGVVYHLKNPLNFNTPYVRAICLPLFWANPKSGFNSNQLPNSLFTLIQFGFAKITKRTSNPNSAVSRSWELRVWKSKALDQKVCDSLLRYYYGNIKSTICFTRTYNRSSMGDYWPTHIFKRLAKVTGNTSEILDDSELCHSHGSGVSIGLGKTVYFLGAVCLIPGQKKQRKCDDKTVYFMALSRDASEAVRMLQWFQNLIFCGSEKFACSNSSCIPLSQTCDHTFDCEDRSDELPGLCNWKKGWNSVQSLQLNLTNQSRLKPLKNALASKCPTPESNISTKTKCTVFDTAGREMVDCHSTSFYPGTDVRVECDEFHKPPKFSHQYLNLTCGYDGIWAGVQPFRCEPECGVKLKGQRYNGFPWDVAFYRNGIQSCGGTLIEKQFILTHSSCLTSWPKNSMDLQVVIRPVHQKFAKTFNGDISDSVQIKNVWFSEASSYANGLALVQLEKEVQTNADNKPMPVCYLNQPSSNISPGKIGFISSPALARQTEKITNLTILPEQECNLEGQSTQFCTTNHDEILIGSGLVVTLPGSSNYALRGVFTKLLDSRAAIFLDIYPFSEWMFNILESNS